MAFEGREWSAGSSTTGSGAFKCFRQYSNWVRIGTDCIPRSARQRNQRTAAQVEVMGMAGRRGKRYKDSRIPEWQKTERPAVGDDMVHDQQQRVLAIVKLQQ